MLGSWIKNEKMVEKEFNNICLPFLNQSKRPLTIGTLRILISWIILKEVASAAEVLTMLSKIIEAEGLVEQQCTAV